MTNQPSGHTPEPWRVDGAFIVIGDGMDEKPVNIYNMRPDNRERICACVNACQGMADPAKEIAELRRENKALGSWACSTCQARFTETVAPVLMEGVTRCSKCVEVEVLSGMLAAANKRAKDWEQAASELKCLLSVNRQAVKLLAVRCAKIIDSWGPTCVAKDDVHMAVCGLVADQDIFNNPIARAAIEAARQAEGGS